MHDARLFSAQLYDEARPNDQKKQEYSFCFGDNTRVLLEFNAGKREHSKTRQTQH